MYYAGVVEPNRPVRLLLGPFRERGLAVAALEPARDLDYLVAGAARSPIPTHVCVVPVQVTENVTPPTGELNEAAVDLLNRSGSPEPPHPTTHRLPCWLRRTR